jgi:hypothetical protein
MLKIFTRSQHFIICTYFEYLQYEFRGLDMLDDYDDNETFESIAGDRPDDIISDATGEPEDVSEFKFAKYAATYFTAQMSHSFLRRQIREPLLHHDEETDR